MDECASGFAGHLSRLFYWLRECIGSDDWLACVTGIPSGGASLPNAKGFHLNSAHGLPSRGFSADIAPRCICFRVFGSSEFPNTFKEKYDSRMQTQGNHRNASMGIKSSLFIADNQTSLVQSNQRAYLA
jgi:hypothetical protein